MKNEDVTIRLTVQEFVVLDEFLRRFSGTDRLSIEDQAERNALWNLQCLFEKYPNRSDDWPSLEAARNEIRSE
jgi:hypothetical protein